VFVVLLALAGCGDPDDMMRSDEPSSESVALDSSIPSTTPPPDAVQVEHGQDELVELQREVFAVMQATSGDGWRLLAVERTGDSSRTRVQT
jgi:hypothetical protein